MYALPPETHIGGVHLGISDLQRSLAFYQGLLGFKLIRKEGDQASLAADGKDPVALFLEEMPNGIPKPPRSSGLYHVAIRYPDRGALANALRLLIENQWPLQGFADHGVSEAIYLPDPDGLGLELYVDRPRDSWVWQGQSIAMVTEPLDVQDLLVEADRAAGTHPNLPQGTDIGHIHLQVGDLKSAREFYHQDLGFEITQGNFPGALFLAAGRYHHHLGLNMWAGRGAPVPPLEAVGLRAYSLVLPSAEALKVLFRELEGKGISLKEWRWLGEEVEPMVRDPIGIAVVLVDGSKRGT